MVIANRMLTTVGRYGRQAFTMIELIFAIVVIGVTVLTVPLMIETNNKALEGNVAQEAIFLTSSVLSVTTTLVWDENSIVSTPGTDNYVLAKILDVGAVNSTYGRTNADSNIRVGGLNQDLHRQFFDYNGGGVAPGAPLTETLTASLEDSAANISGFKQAYSVVAKRYYVSDDLGSGILSTAASGVSNLKLTEVSIQGEDGEIIAKLRAYTANIGEVDFARRSF